MILHSSHLLTFNELPLLPFSDLVYKKQFISQILFNQHNTVVLAAQPITHLIFPVLKLY